MAEKSPDEALAKGRVLARNILASTEAHITVALMAADLAEVFQDLDEAMNGGGVPPEAWRPPRRPDQDQRNAAASSAVERERFYDEVARQKAKAQIDAQLERLRQGSADRAEMERQARKQRRKQPFPRGEN